MDQEKGKQLQNLIRYRHNLNEGKPPQRKGKNPDKKGLRGGREH